MKHSIKASFLPVSVDLDSLQKRLAIEEKQLSQDLAELENKIRKFEDFEHPAYEQWIRLEFGPELLNLEQLYEQMRERQILALRIQEIVNTQKLTPREALYVAQKKREYKPQIKKGFDADEISARRRAKLETKRAAKKAERREEKKQKKRDVRSTLPESSNGTQRERLLSLFRSLARRLHPDSPLAIKSLPAERILNLWLEVQSAYHASNDERLVAISAWLSQEAGSSTPDFIDFSFSERFERIRVLIKSIARLKKRLIELETHPAWGFLTARGSEKKKIRQRAAFKLEDETARAQSDLETLDDFIESIGPAKPPRERGR